MKTLELVTKLIEEKGICPVIKRKFIESKMSWILQNPETNKYVVISEKDVDELNNLYHIKSTCKSVEEDPFLFKC